MKFNAKDAKVAQRTQKKGFTQRHRDAENAVRIPTSRLSVRLNRRAKGAPIKLGSLCELPKHRHQSSAALRLCVNFLFSAFGLKFIAPI